MNKPSKSVIQALAVTAELTNTLMSEAAARIFAADLARYPEQQVLAALDRCRREVKSKLTPSDVISRLDDGRPTPDEAWAMIPTDERQSIVWTEEMAQAWGIAHELEDRIAARMAFLAAYRRLVQQARDHAIAVKWAPSLGHDPLGRQQALDEAVRQGRLTLEQAQRAHPNLEFHPSVLAKLPGLKQIA